MTDVHIVTHENRAHYEDLIEEQHKVRHAIFVGERRWMALERSDGRDVDAYDNEHAVYLLAVDGSKLVAGTRLYPTMLPHMISDVFPHLVDRPSIPRAPNIWEWTRYFVVRERRYGRADCRMLQAVQRYCLDQEIARLTAVVETFWLQRWMQAGFDTSPLGLPQIIEGQPTLAVSIAISERSHASVSRVGGLRRDSLVAHHLPGYGEARRVAA